MTDLSERQKIPGSFAVTLAVTDEIRRTLNAGDGAIALAESFEIDCAEMAQAASDQRATFTKQILKFEALRKSFVEPGMQIVERARALFNPTILGLTRAKEVLNGKLLEWNEKEQERVREENAKRQEAARKARQEAEQKAAQERARAEEIAAQRRREAEQAEEARRKAEAEGNARAAAAAASAAAKATEQAQAAIENGEAAAQTAQLQAAAVATAAAPAAPAKIAGFTTRENWIAELDSGLDEQAVIRKIAAAMTERPDLVGLLKLDMSAANRLAKVLKKAFSVPGLTARDAPIGTGTRK